MLQATLNNYLPFYISTIKIYGEMKTMSAIGAMVNRTIMGVLTVVIFVAVAVALGPTVITAMASINATTLSGVPIATVIILLADYFAAFYYLALVIGAIVGIWAVVKMN